MKWYPVKVQDISMLKCHFEPYQIRFSLQQRSSIIFMKGFLPTQRRSLWIMTLLALSILFLVQCMSNDNKSNKPQVVASSLSSPAVSYQQFAGSATCRNCHKAICDSFAQTHHFLTSRNASLEAIKGSFTPGKNKFSYRPWLYVAMEKRDSGLFQVAYSHGEEKVAGRIDIVMGSGAKGQTYLSWRNDELFQLPVSYLTEADQWANSPGYPDRVVYNRPVTSRCMECHSTYAEVTSPPNREPESFARDQMILGITCERCHGPGARHVAYETAHPNDPLGKYIIDPSGFTRQQSLDMCALCHGGRLQKTQPSFSFQAGDTLSKYFIKNVSAPDTKEIDVHGNQLALLEESQCFQRSAHMTCVTCHDTHANERDQVALFSQRCMSCHNKEHGTFCKINPATVSNLSANCIDCHMPKQPSMSIALLLQGHIIPTAALIHTHIIKVYPDATRRFLSKKKG